jgi:hypothetical protein
MTTKAKKKRVTVNLYAHTEGIDKEYNGRLLGFITGEEFNVLLKNKSLQSKFLTVEAVSVDEIAKNYETLNGLRIVVAVKRVDDKDVLKQLFVSEPLDTVSYYYPERKEIGFMTVDNNLLMMTQEEVEQ